VPGLPEQVPLTRRFLDSVLTASLLLLASCASYKVPTRAYGPGPDDPHWAVRQAAVESPIYNYVPRKRAQLKTLDPRWLSWCFLGNEDDGIFGEYAGNAPYSTNITVGTFCSWSVLRNPTHNFSAYVIGSADWKRHYNYSVIGVGGRKPARVFSNAAKWPKHDEPFFDIGFNDFKPYVKFNPWVCDLFFGWRKSGSFEIKVRADFKKLKKSPPKDSQPPNPGGPACNPCAVCSTDGTRGCGQLQSGSSPPLPRVAARK
jgi:hypothetical protein